MSQIIIDVETKKLFSEINSRDPGKLEISYVGILKVDDKGLFKPYDYQGFFEEDLGSLWPILEKSDRVIGFNIINFDFPALKPYYTGDLMSFPRLDMLNELEKILSHRVSLQSIAQATLNEGKSGSGLDAVEYWRKGDKDSLSKYCRQDVEVTARVFRYGLENKKLRFTDRLNNPREVAVDFSYVKSNPKVQMTLGMK